MNSMKQNHYHNRSMHHGFKQHGFTLIELMVAMVISMVLMLGVINVFVAGKTSYNLQSGMGRLQENGRYAMDILAQNIGMAGFTTGLSPINKLNTANLANNFTSNAKLGLTFTSGQASDVIEINYQSATDCLGNGTGATGIATDRYFLNGTNLMCLGNGSATAGILAEGIDNMQILYGEDSDKDGITDLYVNADNLTTTNDITSVRIAILASTVDEIGTKDNSTYTMLDVPPIGPVTDGRIRKVFSRTILLRNK